MKVLRRFVEVKNRRITIELPDDFNYDKVEVLILPKADVDDLSYLSREIETGFESGISNKSHEEIFQELKKKYA